MHLKMSSAKWRPFCLGLCVKNTKVSYLQCLTLLVLKPEYSRQIELIPRLLMPWRHKESAYQQPCYDYAALTRHGLSWQNISTTRTFSKCRKLLKMKMNCYITGNYSSTTKAKLYLHLVTYYFCGIILWPKMWVYTPWNQRQVNVINSH